MTIFPTNIPARRVQRSRKVTVRRLWRAGMALALIVTLGNGLQALAGQLQPPLLLTHHPLAVADALMAEHRWQEVRLLARFASDHVPVDPQYAALAMAEEADRHIESTSYRLREFANGALTGEASSTYGLLGALSLDMLVLGDVRDLLVQGYHEYQYDDGDPLIMALSATGLLMTLAPHASWAPSLFKVGWRSGRVRGPLRDELRTLAGGSLRSGDFRRLKAVLSDFSHLVSRLGVAPAWRLLDEVESTADLARLTRSVKIAPIESYAMVSINGIDGLQHVGVVAKSAGRLTGPVKVAVRQQRFLSRLLDHLALPWLIVTLAINLLLLVWSLRSLLPAAVTRRRRSRRERRLLAAGPVPQAG